MKILRVHRAALLMIHACAALSPLASAQQDAVEASPLTPERETDYVRHEVLGFTAMVHTDLLAEDALWQRVRIHLAADLDEIKHLLPAHAIEHLQHTAIWVELQGRVVPAGMSGRGKYFHPSKQWLSKHGILPIKAGGIEIANAHDYLNWRRNQPYGLLHEFAHAWWHAMPQDRRVPVIAAFDAAVREGLYEQVGYNLAPSSESRRAYALSNVGEYFAELSEAHFALNDFEPMTARQLRAHDPRGAAAVEQAWATPLEPRDQSQD